MLEVANYTVVEVGCRSASAECAWIIIHCSLEFWEHLAYQQERLWYFTNEVPSSLLIKLMGERMNELVSIDQQ
jgi:hypothetical protein